jgi:hypothetical protein
MNVALTQTKISLKYICTRLQCPRSCWSFFVFSLLYRVYISSHHIPQDFVRYSLDNQLSAFNHTTDSNEELQTTSNRSTRSILRHYLTCGLSQHLPPSCNGMKQMSSPPQRRPHHPLDSERLNQCPAAFFTRLT